MFKAMKELFTSGNKDLRHRIYFTLACLTVFILGISIRVPGTEDLTKNLGFLELINTIGGGALKNFSIFALGVMPYITASIITQLLQMDIFPYFTELRKQGYTGRQKINEITRYMGIAFAFVEGYAFAFAFLGNSGNPLFIKIKGSNSNETKIYKCSSSDKVEWLREIISKDLDIGLDDFILIHKDKILKDEKTLSSYRLRNNHEIHISYGWEIK